MPKGLETKALREFAIEATNKLIAIHGDQTTAAKALADGAGDDTIGASQTMISRAKAGKVSGDNLLRIAFAAGYSVERVAKALGVAVPAVATADEDARVVAEYLRAKVRERLRTGESIPEIANAVVIDEGVLRKIWGGKAMSDAMAGRLAKALGLKSIDAARERAHEWWSNKGRELLESMRPESTTPLSDAVKYARGIPMSDAEILSLLESTPREDVLNEAKWMVVCLSATKEPELRRRERWKKEDEQRARIEHGEGLRRKSAEATPPIEVAPDTRRKRRAANAR